MLVWKLVRIHKGKISIESVENKGTRVKVIFPQKQFRSQQVPTKTVQQESVELQYLIFEKSNKDGNEKKS